MKKTAKSTKQYLALQIDPASIDKEKKQFKVVVATETPVFRRANYLNSWAEDYFEVLVCNKDNMRTQRMDNGVCPLLDNHDQYSGVTKQYGSLISYEVGDNEVRATIQFSVDPAHEGVWKNIEAGIIRGISARYIPWVYERQVAGGDTNKIPNYRATDWEITEVSLAPVPADYNSMVRSNDSEPQGEKFEVVINNFSQNTNTRSNMKKGQDPNAGGGENEQPNTQEEQNRSQAPAAPAPGQPVNVEQVRTQAAEAERTRIKTIRTAVRTAGFDETYADELVENGTTVDAARAAIFDKMAAQQSSQNPAPKTQNAAVTGEDERTKIRSAMTDALLHRANPGTVELKDQAHDFKYMSMLELGRSCLLSSGDNAAMRYSPNEAVKRAIATTDFAALLTSTVERQIRRTYDAVVPEWQHIARRTTSKDFREKTGIAVDGKVTFEEIAEGGEYKNSLLITNDSAKLKLKTYGRKITITRQAIINDDLDVFGKLPELISLGAQNFQAAKVWALLTGNKKAPDDKAMFHVDHKNLAAAGGASALQESSLSAARIAMYRQLSPAKEQLSILPKILLVPIELEMTAEKLMTAVLANATGSVNTLAKKYQVMTSPFLTSATEWYLAADPKAVEGLVYAYLEGEEGLYTDSEVSFDNDAVVTKARLDFDAAIWGYQGWYKSPGA